MIFNTKKNADGSSSLGLDLFGIVEKSSINKKNNTALNNLISSLERGVNPAKALGKEFLNLSKSNQVLFQEIVNTERKSGHLNTKLLQAAQGAKTLGVS